MMKSYCLHLIRHGLTAANLDGEYIGATDVELSSEGINRLKNLKSEFTYPKADKVYSSPLLRCKDTAKILYPEKEIEQEKGLAECDFGEWEGQKAEDLKKDKNFLAWLNNSAKAPPKGGESLKEFSNRVLLTFEKIVENAIKTGCKDTAIITHGGVIMTFLAAYGVPRAKFYDWLVNNGCGYSIRIMPSLWMRQKVGEVYAKIPNDLTHENSEESMYILDLVREAANKAYGDSST